MNARCVVDDGPGTQVTQEYIGCGDGVPPAAEMLTCSVSLSDLWPADAVLVQRPADDALDWLRKSHLWADRS